MFEAFANVWTVVGPSAGLKAGALQPIMIAGERIVLFRDASGEPAALLDRCPHRGAALSLGRLRDGEVECPFHGWRFDGAGRNCGVPWNPEAKLDTLSANPLPIREIGGLLWVYTGPTAAGEPPDLATLREPRIRVTVQEETWAAHWTRAMENMLDVPHLPFVHGATIGRGMRASTGSRMDVRWVPHDGGAAIESAIGETRTARLNYLYPNAMELVIDPPGRMLRILAVCLPVGPRETRMIFVTMRDFARLRAADPLFRWSNRRIAKEDRAIIESSDPPEVPPPSAERSVRTDAPTLAFRKLYFERLKGSSA
ncbi:MAG: hypothetical protein B7Z08_07090 [Sphingomonadales bacterium 32-68-7]|nr:MAG: hypothetical protein B7Z33_04015 [Sphingomonadales bacterium 12-68-11]OYX09002.1 MAG: hypothetical protein B7Z08_07090 [Sphingomonadales bacterium 32-68-7]